LAIRFAAIAFVALGLVSCAAGGVFQLSPEEQAALDAANATPLLFTVPRDRSIASWDRAHDFVNRYSTMKLRNATDSLLVTYDTPTYQQVPSPVETGSSIRFGYSVSRSSAVEGIQYRVQCEASSKLGEKDAQQNAHLAAYYIMTGRLGCERCIVR
jgi:hypothetical protein